MSQHRNRRPGSYKDTGCEFAPSCLNCPFPDCIKDELRQKQLDQMKVLISQGKSREEVAAELSITISGVKWAKAKHHRSLHQVAVA